jgi:glutamyl-tRNA reductase
MDTRLRYLSVSHHTAPVARRERFHLSDAEKQRVAKALQGAFPDLGSLLLLVTCNRTECYFESEQTSAAAVRDFLLRYLVGTVEEADQADFRISDNTGEAALHLLKVSAGLESSVLGDAEIIHQIRKAYHISLEMGLQGSLLERCMQTLFRTHKRVSNETGFRDGTTSTAYKALKLIGDTFGSEAGHKKILFVGAGDIVTQLFKYNRKFGYKNVFVTNRTESRSEKLARVNKVSAWPWEKLLSNDLGDFDVIISAVSNASGLIHKGIGTQRPILLIDLAVPGNFSPGLANHPSVVLHNLDSIASQLKSNRLARTAAVDNVEEIILQEWSFYRQWQEMRPFRTLMAERKKQVFTTLLGFGIAERNGWSKTEIAVLANQIMRKVLKKPETLQNSHNLETLVARYAPVQAL